jgi:hypothetical protein
MRIIRTVCVLMITINGFLASGESRGESLTLDIPVASIPEDTTEIVATVTRSGVASETLTVSVGSSDQTAIYVPGSIRIPSGSSSAELILRIVNDGDIDGTQSATITVTADSLDGDSGSLDVLDDDTLDWYTLGGHLSGIIAENTYVVLSDITVDVERILTLEPGSELRFEPKVALITNGSLITEGESGKEILFTSNAVLPTPGDWKGIRHIGSKEQNSRLNHVTISFSETGLMIYGPDPRIVLSHSNIGHNSRYGIEIRGGQSSRVKVLNNRIHDNEIYGILVTAYASGFDCDEGVHVSSLIESNEIYHNGGGVRLSASSSSSRTCFCWVQLFCSLPSATVGGDVRQNHIHDNGLGITVYTSRVSIDTWFGIKPGLPARVNTLISNNIVVDNLGNGISLTTGGDLGGDLSTDIVNNTIVSNDGAGIWHSEDVTSRFTAKNNILCRNERGIVAESDFDPNQDSGYVVSYNNVADNNNGDWVNYPDTYGNLATTNVHGTPADVAMNISVDPYFASLGYWDENGTPGDFNDDSWIDGDYHLMSQVGRWDPITETWVSDDVISPCVDAGNPTSAWRNELLPNGKRINMGAYGGTPEASMSLLGE